MRLPSLLRTACARCLRATINLKRSKSVSAARRCFASLFLPQEVSLNFSIIFSFSSALRKVTLRTPCGIFSRRSVSATRRIGIDCRCTLRATRQKPKIEPKNAIFSRFFAFIQVLKPTKSWNPEKSESFCTIPAKIRRQTAKTCTSQFKSWPSSALAEGLRPNSPSDAGAVHEDSVAVDDVHHDAELQKNAKAKLKT